MGYYDLHLGQKGGDGSTYHRVIFPLVIALVESQLEVTCGQSSLSFTNWGETYMTWCATCDFFPFSGCFFGFDGYGVFGVDMGFGARQTVALWPSWLDQKHIPGLHLGPQKEQETKR